MDKDFFDFSQEYLNGEYKQFVKTTTEKIKLNMDSKEEFAKSIETLEKEIVNMNINLLYAYHQWLMKKINN